jgi:hypothetical protein
VNSFWGIIVVILIPLAAYLLISPPGKYRKLFSDAHLLEIWNRMAQVKAAALDAVDRPASSNGDGLARGQLAHAQRFTTTANLTLLYTIDQQGDRYHHHLSMSHRQLLAVAAATYFTALLGEILAVDVRQASLGVSPRMIFHLTFSLDKEQETQFAATPVVAPDPMRLPQVRQRVLEIRRELTVMKVAV